MTIESHQDWLVGFYQRRDWFKHTPAMRINYLTEELGELSRAVRTIEVGRDHPGEAEPTRADANANLIEELADCMDQVLILAAKYYLSAQELINASHQKLSARFPDDLKG